VANLRKVLEALQDPLSMGIMTRRTYLSGLAAGWRRGVHSQGLGAMRRSARFGDNVTLVYNPTLAG